MPDGARTEAGGRATIAARPLALLRIGAGTLVVADLADRLRDFHAFYTAGGLVPEAPSFVRWSWLALSADPHVTLGLYLAAIPIALLAAAGLFTRPALVATFLALVSLGHRNPYVANGGDAALRALVFWLALIDCGADLSLDVALGRRVRRAHIPFLPVLLLQLQVAGIYLFAGLGKTGPGWLDGSALERALTVSDWARGAGHWLAEQPHLCRALTYATLGFEVAFAPLVFLPVRRLRALVLAAGALLHLGIFFTMRVGIFSLVMPLTYLAFFGSFVPRCFGRVETTTGKPARQHAPATAAAMIAVFALILAGQVASFAFGPRTPDALFGLLEAIGLRQDWRMFAPDAPRVAVDFRAPGRLTDGREVELTETTLAGLTRQPGFRYSRWHRVRNMLAFQPADLVAALGRFTCRRHPAAPNGATLAAFELQAIIYNVDGGAPPRTERRLRQSCGSAAGAAQR